MDIEKELAKSYKIIGANMSIFRAHEPIQDNLNVKCRYFSYPFCKHNGCNNILVSKRNSIHECLFQCTCCLYDGKYLYK